jgi:hypothetical protein
MHACKIHARKMHACKLHACKLHACKMHACKLLAPKIPACKVRAYKVHTHKCTPVRYMPVKCTPVRCPPPSHMPIRCTPLRHTPVRCTTVKYTPIKCIPGQRREDKAAWRISTVACDQRRVDQDVEFDEYTDQRHGLVLFRPMHQHSHVLTGPADCLIYVNYRTQVPLLNELPRTPRSAYYKFTLKPTPMRSNLPRRHLFLNSSLRGS